MAVEFKTRGGCPTVKFGTNKPATIFSMQNLKSNDGSGENEYIIFVYNHGSNHFQASQTVIVEDVTVSGGADEKILAIQTYLSTFFVEAPGAGGVDYMSVRKVANPKIILFGTSLEAQNESGVAQ